VRFLSPPRWPLFLFALAACSKPVPGGERQGVSVAPTSAPTVPPPTGDPGKSPTTLGSPQGGTSAPPAPAAALSDLDVGALKRKLACAGDTRRNGCRILNEFEGASPFSPKIPSGEGRWVGTAYTIEKGAEKSELMIVSVSQTPTSTVPAGELALKIGIGPLPDNLRAHGMKLVNALSHGDTVSKLNQAAPYVKAWKPGDAQGTMATSGVSVRRVADDTYLRQTSTKILLVRLKAQSAATAPEATFAELWAASW
jgi:hypothetical protein